MHGETSLRGMGRWGRAHAEEVVWRLRLWRYPGLRTVWYVVQRVASGELEAVLRPWVGEEQADAGDGTWVRGRKRAGERALAVLTMVGQELGQVVAQRRVDAANEVAALALVDEVPLAGTVVSADAGILHAPVGHTVVNKGGFIGLVNRNQPELTAAVAAWISWWSQHRGKQPASHVETSNGHGRSAQREGWIVPGDTEMQHYLVTHSGWPEVQWCGRIRRSRWTATRQEARM